MSRQKTTRLIMLFISICALTWTGSSNTSEEQNHELSSSSDTAPIEETTQGIEFFQGAYNDALEQARKEDKLMFVFVDAPGNVNCDVMRETVFPLPEVGEFFNSRFLSFWFDLSLPRNGYGSDTRDYYEFAIGEYPAYRILDSSGDELALVQGRLSSKQLISVIKRVIGESESTFDNWQERYDAGDRSPGFVQRYLMEVIEEVAIVRHDDDSRENRTIFSERVAKYKEIADAYFASKSSTDLINETDVYLIMHFNEPPVRRDTFVEFVLQHYDDFLAVSSDMEMAYFTLRATTNAIEIAAQAGDEKFVEYVESLETYPLKQAVDYERTRVPRSYHFPESIKKSVWGVQYHKVRGEWDQVYEILLDVLEELKEEQPRWRYWSYSTVAAELMQSNDPVHVEKAVEIGKTIYESDYLAPQYAAIYVAALQAAGKKYSAEQVTVQFKNRMSGSSRRAQLNSFEESLSFLLTQDSETTTTDD